jgi:hypothetical protein
MLCSAHVDAAPFTLQVGGPTGADGSAGFTLSGDTAGGIGKFVFREDEQASNFLNFLTTSFVDPNATFTISNRSQSVDNLGLPVRSADFLITDPAFKFVVSSDDGTQTTITGYRLPFRLSQELDPSGHIIVDYSATVSQLLIPPSSNIDMPFVTAIGDPLALVPLPSTLPLFGSALLIAGAFAYRTRVTSTP